MRKIFLLLLIFLFVDLKTAFAISSPNLISPENNSTVSSSKLTWDTPSYQLYGTTPYRIQVDESTDFSNPYRDYNTKNNYYSPTLSEGTWFWRVKSKDISSNWSDWSTIWSFVLSTSSSTATPTPSPSQTTDDSTLSSSRSASSFTTSDTPSNINSSQSFLVSVELNLPNNPTSTFYIKGAFKKAAGSNYFGLTKVGSTWIKNGSSYSSQKAITTDSVGHWSGVLEIMPDDEDSGFTGSDSYIFKVARYSDSGSGPNWSNEVTIYITGSPSAQSTTSPKPTTKTSSNLTASSNPSSKSIVKLPIKTSFHSATVAGIETFATPSAEASPTTEVKSEHQINFIPYLGGGLILAGIGSLIYLLLKQRYNSRR